jgi:Na+-transporting methylmalonyl-CoA/oxaloacetate decarboxylase gamma subunit
MLSIIGITITFIALGLIILAMVVLERLFPPPPLASDKEDLEETQFVSSLAYETEEEEVVAAIAVALAHLHSLGVSRSGLGKALESGRGPWWTMSKFRQGSTITRTSQGRR